MVDDLNVITSAKISRIDLNTARKIIDRCDAVKESTGKSPNYREPNRNVINKYAKQLLRGEWEPATRTGACLVFDSNGLLNDGNHRLRAMLIVGKEIPNLELDFYVMVGFNSRSTTDTYAPRKFNSILKERNEIYFDDLATTTVLFDAYLRDGKVPYDKDKATEASLVRYDKVLNKYPEIRNSVNMVASRRTPNSRIIPVSLLATLHCIFTKIDPDKANEYVDTMQGVNENATITHPVSRLRELLIRMKVKQERYHVTDLINLCYSAWNRLYDGDNKKNYRIIAHESISTKLKAIPDLRGMN